MDWVMHSKKVGHSKIPFSNSLPSAPTLLLSSPRPPVVAAASAEQAGPSPRLSSLLPPAAIGSKSSSRRRYAPFILTGAERRWPGGTLPPAACGTACPRDDVARGGVRPLAARGTTPRDGCGRGGAAVEGGAHPPAARGTARPRGGDARNGAAGIATTALRRGLTRRPHSALRPLREQDASSPTARSDRAPTALLPRRTSSASPHQLRLTLAHRATARASFQCFASVERGDGYLPSALAATQYAYRICLSRWRLFFLPKITVHDG
uniref:Uncharacterized protein n=1 Tax=Oryza barthii TaxID=65489 RepID=A0A0D3F3Y6_9ORYZ